MRILIVVIMIVVGASIWGIAHFYQGSQGKVLEEWETTNAVFRIRVTAYVDTSQFPAGGRYVFHSAPVGSENWREIMTLVFDDPVPIPREQVRFVDDRVGYAFMGETYAVTTDGSRTWMLWNSELQLKGRADVLSRSIEKVHVQADGTGIMQLYEHPYQKGKVPILRTQNYGQHWNLE